MSYCLVVAEIAILSNHCPICGRRLDKYTERPTCKYCRETKREFEKVAYATARKYSICTRCQRAPATDGSTLCESCLKKRKEFLNSDSYKKHIKIYVKSRYYTYKNKGICVKCGKEMASNNTCLCEKCRIKSAEHKKKIYYKNKENGICTRCGKEMASNNTCLCEKCRIKYNIMRRKEV